MTQPRKTAILGALVLCALAACAGQRMTWERAGADADQIAFDLQTCRSQARARLSSYNYYAHEQAPADAARADAVGRSDGTAQMDKLWSQARGKRDFADLVEDCMAGQGYRRVPVGTQAA